ncbi:MAG: NfeD family protein [Gammaproteobacteria bacterium]|nr:NfeD family protein [Gammaproteobacteria bacterium]
MTWWAWMILGAVLLGAELFAVDAQFYLVFLGVSAALVGLASLFGVVPPEWVQWLAFAVLSLFFFLTFRRTLYTRIRGGGENYRDSLAGEAVTVAEDLAVGADARTEYRGSAWTVRNVGDTSIAAGSRAVVVEVDGLTLKVKAE